MKSTKFLCILVAIGFGANNIFAQTEAATTPDASKSPFPSKKDFNKWSIGINAGMTIGHTDIQPADFGDAKKNMAFGLTVTKMMSHSFGLQGQLLKGKLADENKYYYYDNTYFEHVINLVYNFGNISFLSSEPKLSMQCFLGLGLNHSDSKSYRVIDDQPAISSFESKTSDIAIPVGIVMKYKLPKSLTLELGYSLRNVNNDRLDRFDTYLGANDDLDRFSYYSFGLSATIGKKEKDIDWVNPLNTLYEDMADLRDKMSGLGGDKDADGVADLFDKDNQTPEGVTVDGGGKALDIDGDGVADHIDEDRFTDKGAVVNEKGKALDTDGDGVPDHRDLDNNTKPGELVNFQGVKILTGAPSGPAGSGETKVVYSGGGGGTGFLPSVHFNLNSSKIEYGSYEKLAIVANVMKQNTGIKLKVVGHADNTGSESYNMSLSAKRAQSVVDHLTKVYGVDASRLSVEGKGKSDPLAQAGKANSMNRRADFMVQ